MTRLVRLLAMLCIAAGLALVAAACSKAQSCNGTGNCNNYGNPLAPGTSNEVTGVQLTAWNKDITIGSGPCEADVTVEAKINPPSAPQKVDEWKVSAGEFVRTGDTTGVFKLRGAGTYTVTAIAQGKSVTETITLKCGAAQPPPAGQEPSVDLKFNGQDGPFNSNSPLSGEITASLKQCTTGYWTDGPFKGQIFGNGSKWTVTVNASIRYAAECEHQGLKDSDELRFTIGSSPPPSPTPVYACSDGKDNDGDGLVDAADPGCHTNNDINQPYNPTDNDEYNPPPPPSLSCSGMNAAYSRTDGSGSHTVAVNQNVPIRLNQQSGWLSHCEVFYGVDKPSVIKAVGVVPIEVCSGSSCNWYYGGKSAVVTGVWPGSAEVFSQVVIRENMGQSNERWVLASGANMRFARGWTVGSALQSLGVKMLEAKKWVDDPRVPGGKVCLTWECR